jgi:hypothetical protein
LGSDKAAVRLAGLYALEPLGQDNPKLRLLRHKTLRITLETYVHWWPTRERPRGVVGAVLLGGRNKQDRI